MPPGAAGMLLLLRSPWTNAPVSGLMCGARKAHPQSSIRLSITLLFYDIPGVLQGHRQNCTKNSKLRDKIQ
jgi:hypothetical protein